MDAPNPDATQPAIPPACLWLADDLANRISRATEWPRVVNPEWVKRMTREPGETECAYCGSSLAELSVRDRLADHLVPKHLGGPTASENVVLGCRSCVTRKAQQDIGERIVARPDGGTRKAESIGRMAARRMAVLENCPNHLTPHRPGAALDVITKHLHERWSHPRLALFAAHREPTSFIGWSDRSGPGDALGTCLAALRFRHQGAVVSHGSEGVTLVALPPSEFLSAVWTLIELHGLVTPLLTGDEPDLETDWRHAWRYHVTGLTPLRTRRVARGLVVPGPAREKSETPGARALRHKRALIKAKAEWDAAEEAYQLARRDPSADPRVVWDLLVKVKDRWRVYQALSETT